MTGMVLDLFAGAGGWSEGLRLAGHDGLEVGIEWDLPACRTAVKAGHLRVCADVASYPMEPFAGRVTGLCASPPCTSFSSAGDGAGRRLTGVLIRALTQIAEGRNALGQARRDCTRILRSVALADRKLRTATPEQRSEWALRQAELSLLVVQPLRWAVALRPRWVALEQVPAVLPLWQHTTHLLRGLGYHAWCGVLHSEEFGVPQTRWRAVLTASMDGPVGPPSPTHQRYRSGVAPQTEDDLFGPPLPPPVSMAQALGWNSGVIATGNNSQIGGGVIKPYERDTSAPSPTLTGNTSGWVMRSNYGTGGDPQDRGERRDDEPAPTVTSKVDRNLWLRNGSRAHATRRSLDQPAATIHSQRDGNLQWREPETTKVTVTEAGVLQSFPADYPWTGTKTQQFTQAGNAVPPLLAAAVLRSLIT